MSDQELYVVTGAFGYSGKYIAARLLKEGHRVPSDSDLKPTATKQQAREAGFTFDRRRLSADAVRNYVIQVH